MLTITSFSVFMASFLYLMCIYFSFRKKKIVFCLEFFCLHLTFSELTIPSRQQIPSCYQTVPTWPTLNCFHFPYNHSAFFKARRYQNLGSAWGLPVIMPSREASSPLSVSSDSTERWALLMTLGYSLACTREPLT